MEELKKYVRARKMGDSYSYICEISGGRAWTSCSKDDALKLTLKEWNEDLRNIIYDYELELMEVSELYEGLE